MNDENFHVGLGLYDTPAKIIQMITRQVFILISSYRVRFHARRALACSIPFAKAQNLVILVKGIKYGDSGGHGIYNVEITGPVELGK